MKILFKTIERFVKERKIDLEKVNFDILLSQDSTFIDKTIETRDDNKKLALIYLLSNENFNSEINRLAREDAKEIISFITDYMDSKEENYQVTVENILKREGVIADLYKPHFDDDSYKKFMSELENSSPESIALFVKKLKCNYSQSRK